MKKVNFIKIESQNLNEIEELLKSEKNDGLKKISEYKEIRKKSYLKIIEKDIKNIQEDPGKYFLDQISLIVSSSLNPNFWIKKYHVIYKEILPLLKESRNDYMTILNIYLDFVQNRRLLLQKFSSLPFTNPNFDIFIFCSQLDEDETEKLYNYYQRNSKINQKEIVNEILEKILLLDKDLQNTKLILKFQN